VHRVDIGLAYAGFLVSSHDEISMSLAVKKKGASGK
jgi:hypothetical protein